MPTIEQWMLFLDHPRREFQVRAARALLSRSEEVPLSALIHILDRLSDQGLGGAVEDALLRRNDSVLPNVMVPRLSAPDPFVREVAATVLGRLGSRSSTPHLLKALVDPSWMVRRAAAFALAELKDPASERELLRVYSLSAADNFNVRWGLETALEALGATFSKHPILGIQKASPAGS